jgi:hypothetical protein
MAEGVCDEKFHRLFSISFPMLAIFPDHDPDADAHISAADVTQTHGPDGFALFCFDNVEDAIRQLSRKLDAPTLFFDGCRTEHDKRTDDFPVSPSK